MEILHDQELAPPPLVEQRIAARLGELRRQRSWSLEELSGRSGISRATLSRLERCELSPTAAMLGQLCSVYGWTLSRLISEAEGESPSLVPHGNQETWEDPETRYLRRIVSPPGAELRGELVEVQLPASAVVYFENSPVQRLEHHLWMIEGSLRLELEGASFDLNAGDCLRYVLTGSSKFVCSEKGNARYLVAIVNP